MTTRSTARYPSLLSPLQRGRLHLKNRVVFPGHQTLFSDGGVIGDRLLRYYLERAKGGVAAVIVEGAAVHPTTIKFPNYLLAYDEAIVPTLDRLADALHEHDCKVILQLAHSGSRMNTQDSRTELWAPSAVRSDNSPETPHAMTQRDMAELLDGYEASARHVAESRIDGIEVHAAHEYLLSAFLSPLSNRRTDEFGGSMTNRARYPIEVLRRVRAAARPDQVVGMRLNGSDRMPGGIEPDDAARIASLLTSASDLDYLHISAGRSNNNEAIVPPMDVQPGVNVDAAATVRAAVSIPVIAVGRIKTPEHAEGVLADGKADVIAEARALIADPEWVAKAGADRETIRPCLGCNQGCYGNLVLVRPITCTVNPAVGRETELGIGTRSVADVPRNVVVVGGGPAGMEAAITAAERGHHVTLFERAERLGGQVRFGASVASRAELADIVDFQEAMLRRLGVEIRCGSNADVDTVVAHRPDVVVVATGSTPRPAELPGDGSIAVWSPHELIAACGDGSAGAEQLTNVVVIDEVGHFPAYVPAELARQRGADVTLVTARPSPGWALDPTTAATMFRRLRGLGVRFASHSTISDVRQGGLVVTSTVDDAERRIYASVVVAAVGSDPSDALGELPTRIAVTRVGDCVAPRTALEAIREGRLAGLAV